MSMVHNLSDFNVERAGKITLAATELVQYLESVGPLARCHWQWCQLSAQCSRARFRLTIQQSIYLSIYQSINLPIYLSIYQSINLSIYQSVNSKDYRDLLCSMLRLPRKYTAIACHSPCSCSCKTAIQCQLPLAMGSCGARYMDDPVMPKEEEEMKAVEALSRAMLGYAPCSLFSNDSFTQWKAVIRNINSNLNELLAKSVLYKAGFCWIRLDSVQITWPLLHPSLISRGAARKSDAAAIPVKCQGLYNDGTGWW